MRRSIPATPAGALVDLAGELVGHQCRDHRPSGGNVGIGFAIPVNLVHQVVEQIEHGGTVQHGHLGIASRSHTPARGVARPAHRPGRRTDLIGRAQSPAAKAGLRPGDVVVSIGGQSVADADALHNAIGLLRAGQVAQMTILRDGRPMQLRATVASR
jgi:S1-C subfamily serine protease